MKNYIDTKEREKCMINIKKSKNAKNVCYHRAHVEGVGRRPSVLFRAVGGTGAR